MDRDGYFTKDVARTYDRDHGNTDAATIRQTINTLSQLAGTGAILEFAIGTGRLALALVQHGHVVKGIELSRAMVAELRKKEKSQPIEIVIGDMTSARVDGEFSLVVLAFNTIDNLLSQGQQIECFKNAAAHLAPGGRFIVETQVPPIQRIPFGETSLAFACSPKHWGVDIFDIATQHYTSNHIWINEDAPKQLCIPFRYVWPSELDLMAKIAGLQFEDRWEDWQKTPFSKTSKSHISVWRKPN
jgi:SAM-dependent methyltransferase